MYDRVAVTLDLNKDEYIFKAKCPICDNETDNIKSNSGGCYLVNHEQDRLRRSLKWRFLRFVWIYAKTISLLAGKQMIKLSKEADRD